MSVEASKKLIYYSLNPKKDDNKNKNGNYSVKFKIQNSNMPDMHIKIRSLIQ